jgi:hypothetical protein
MTTKKNATDQQNADAVAFDIQCDVFPIFSPPENVASLLVPHQ